MYGSSFASWRKEMAEFSILENGAGEAAVVCLAAKHLPPASVEARGGRLMLRLTAGREVDAGAVSEAAAAALARSGSVLFATVSGGAVVGESMVAVAAGRNPA